VRIKVCRKDYDWSVRLVYDSRGLPRVTIAMPKMAGVLQAYSFSKINEQQHSLMGFESLLDFSK
jgi:hypothetical protein